MDASEAQGDLRGSIRRHSGATTMEKQEPSELTEDDMEAAARQATASMGGNLTGDE
jgi:hypothetical protein